MEKFIRIPVTGSAQGVMAPIAEIINIVPNASTTTLTWNYQNAAAAFDTVTMTYQTATAAQGLLIRDMIQNWIENALQTSWQYPIFDVVMENCGTTAVPFYPVVASVVWS
tara:strand:+ start:753 stop:1082 length:330 start_codon:yes stop_codon:yes gene_type:complete